MTTAPLDGINVVDFTRVLAGPYCTKLMRDLGATVTKIEPPTGDIGRIAEPHVGALSLYYIQFNAGKRNISVDLNWPEGRELVKDLCAKADVIVENFRPGTLQRFGLAYEQVREYNPAVVYASLSGYGQDTSWRNRPAFAPTVQAESGLTDLLSEHYGDALSGPYNDACSHADLYTGLQAVVAILAALNHRTRTGSGQHVDVSMAATMLSVNERAGAQMSGIDTQGEPYALSATESHIFVLPNGDQLTIAASPLFTPIFGRFCAMMRRNDLLLDSRFATPLLRKKHLPALLEEVRAWLLTFTDLQEMQAQVSEAGLAVGIVRSTEKFSKSEWASEWGAVVDVDDRAGGTVRMPGAPWKFSASTLPPPGIPGFQGEHNLDVFCAGQAGAERLDDLRVRKILLSRRHPLAAFD
jgi:CoA:oxalate CoA-transferase